MTNSGDAAEQIVRMSLEGTEVALRLSGSAAKNIAVALYAIAKNADRNKTKGHQRLSAMLKSGKELKVFTISGEQLKCFAQEAKRYGVVYCALRGKEPAADGIPLWAVTLIGGLLITVLSFVMIMTVYGRFFKLYLYTAIAPVPMAAFAGMPTQNIGFSFLKSYAAVCLEGAIIVLGCIIFSLFAATPPVVNADAAAVSMVWSYVRFLYFGQVREQPD